MTSALEEERGRAEKLVEQTLEEARLEMKKYVREQREVSLLSVSYYSTFLHYLSWFKPDLQQPLQIPSNFRLTTLPKDGPSHTLTI